MRARWIFFIGGWTDASPTSAALGLSEAAEIEVPRRGPGEVASRSLR